EASSYSSALQGEPICRFAYFARHETVASQLPLESDICVRRLEKLNQSFYTRSRNNRIHSSSRNEHRGAIEIVSLRWLVDEHRPKEDCRLDDSGVYEHRCGGDVGTIGIPQCEDTIRIKPVGNHRRANEPRQLLGARAHFLRIEHALGESPEETWRSILQNISAGTQYGGAGRDCLADANEIVLVAAGAMQYEERLSGAGILRGHKAMNESEIFGHALGPRSWSGEGMLG